MGEEGDEGKDNGRKLRKKENYQKDTLKYFEKVIKMENQRKALVTYIGTKNKGDRTGEGYMDKVI